MHEWNGEEDMSSEKCEVTQYEAASTLRGDPSVVLAMGTCLVCCYFGGSAAETAKDSCDGNLSWMFHLQNTLKLLLRYVILRNLLRIHLSCMLHVHVIIVCMVSVVGCYNTSSFEYALPEEAVDLLCSFFPNQGI